MNSELKFPLQLVGLIVSIGLSVYFISSATGMIAVMKNPDPRNLLGANDYAYVFLIVFVLLGVISVLWMYKMIKVVHKHIFSR